MPHPPANHLDRRSFLHAALLAPAAGLLPAASGAIDAHTHFYDPTRPKGVPWPGKDDKLLYRPVLPDEFRRVAGKHGVSSTIVVEASPWVEDNQWLLELARRHRTIVGVVGRLDPATEAFHQHLRRFARDQLFRGIRINHNELRQGLEQKAFLANLRLLVKYDCQLDVNGGPDMPADVARLAARVPDLRVVINHAANLRIDGKEPPAAWRKGLQAAAEARNVFCKVSALVEGTGKTQGDAPSDLGFYRPVLEALWKIFGEERLFYGSNWPVSDRSASYATVHGIVAAFFKEKGARASEKYFAGNARRAYKVVSRD